MTKYIFLITLLLLTACNIYQGKLPPFYEKEDIKITKEELIKEDSGMIISEKPNMCKFFKVESSFKDDIPRCSVVNLTQPAPIIGFKLKKGRYFYETGLLIHSIVATCMDVTGNPSCHKDISPKIDGKPAILYIEVKPGEIGYIGKDIRNSASEIEFIYEFENDKMELVDRIPSIANVMQKKEIKKAIRPKECDFLQEDYMGYEVIWNKNKEKNEKDPRYQACVKELEKLP